MNLWAGVDSNHRTRKRTDLQSVAVGHLATCPMLSHLSESNQRPTDYKSVALPAELKWHLLKNQYRKELPAKQGTYPIFWEGKGK